MTGTTHDDDDDDDIDDDDDDTLLDHSSSFAHARSLNVERARCHSRRRCLVSIGAVTEMACMLCGANTCCCPQLATCVKGSRHRPAVTVWMAPSRFGAPAPLGGAVAALTLRFQAL